MKIQYITGDLFASNETRLVHGCNALGIMGGGCAKIIKDRFPKVFQEYRKIYEITGLKLGEIYPVEVDDKIIINAITQENFGTHQRQTDYDAVVSVFRKIEEQYPNQTVIMPRIGAGLGGGDWSVIADIIETACVTVQPVVYTLPHELKLFPAVRPGDGLNWDTPGFNAP